MKYQEKIYLSKITVYLVTKMARTQRGHQHWSHGFHDFKIVDVGDKKWSSQSLTFKITTFRRQHLSPTYRSLKLFESKMNL